MFTLGGVNGNRQNIGVVSEELKALIPERGEVVRSPTGETFGEECQQQVLLAPQVSQAMEATMHI